MAPPIEPLAPARYKVQFTASAGLRDKLERLQRLMHVGSDDLASVIEQAVTEKLERLERKRFAVTEASPKPRVQERVLPQVPAASRYISGGIAASRPRATAAAVATWTTREDGARSGIDWSTTTRIRTLSASTTACGTSA